jgi:hypothetical protein
MARSATHHQNGGFLVQVEDELCCPRPSNARIQQRCRAVEEIEGIESINEQHAKGLNVHRQASSNPSPASSSVKSNVRVKTLPGSVHSRLNATRNASTQLLSTA